ncbi:peptidyl-prolyl cis-trans isomerase CYP26-2, chloroplastic isoform X2 [Rhododendron vialii]|uniref:peptidyl-prolyl cis-trans isomerase CYP26-2, chloroplastic isoform X2 n=1 Tax=Rhododendron vialii TaxID=182163 RepID=UPI00265E400E|nr:peptidyl-prolyl cis-trans isomerase CYP26-2, chloroplastic isoform X2 [Rhododendron vialii]
MWQTAKLFQSSAQLLRPQTPPTPISDSPTSPSTLSLKHHCRFSRRDLAIFTTTSSLLLLKPLAKTQAEGNPPNTDGNGKQEENSSTTISNSGCLDRTPTKKAFLDISIDGEPIGRIVIGLFGNSVPASVAKFSDFVSGAAGISYRRKEFVKIMPNYVQHGGLRSYGVDAELAKTTGGGGGGNLGIERLREEWERVLNGSCQQGTTKNVEGSVSIIVRDPLKPPPKLKLVARKGKLEIDEEEVGTEPNGTEFLIATKDSPELDAAALVVGRVLEGMEVVHRIGQVKTVQENTSSPYFRVAKLIGDKRAVVAERGFNRPYAKVVVSNCGLFD